MRKALILSAAIVFALASVTASYSQTRKEKRAARKAAVEKFVTDGFKNKDIYIHIERLCPLSYPPREVSSGYFISIKGDTLSCYLPYMGKGYTASMSAISGNSMSVDAKNQKITDMQREINTAEKYFIISFSFLNESLKEQTSCTIQIYGTAQTYVKIDSNSRESISYVGTMEERRD